MKLTLFFCMMVFLAESQEILKLDDAIDLALQQNPNILISSNEKEIARVSNNWYAAGRIPTVAANSFFNNSVTNLNQKLNNGTNIERNGVLNSTFNVNGQFSYRLYGGKRIFIVKKGWNCKKRRPMNHLNRISIKPFLMSSTGILILSVWSDSAMPSGRRFHFLKNAVNSPRCVLKSVQQVKMIICNPR